MRNCGTAIGLATIRSIRTTTSWPAWRICGKCTDIYGAPGFLAAYNAGPARLDDYLSNNRPLPEETRRYVAAIGPNLYGALPIVRSPAEQYAMNALPVNIPRGLRYGRGAVQLASASSSRGRVQLASAGAGSWSGGGRVPARQPVQVAQLQEPAMRPAPLPPQLVAMTPPSAMPPAPSAAPGRGLHLISPAMAADSMAIRRGSAAPGQWAIQIGAFASQGLAQSALSSARGQARPELAIARTYVGTVQGGRGTLWRARMVGLSKETAVQACEKLSRGRSSCIVLSPDAQS